MLKPLKGNVLICERFRKCSGLKKEKPSIILSILRSPCIPGALLRSQPFASIVVSLSRKGLASALQAAVLSAKANIFPHLDLRSTIPKKGEDREKALGSVESSEQKDSDQRHDDPPEESDQWIQNAQIKETDDDKEPVRLQASEEILGSLRYDSHQYL